MGRACPRVLGPPVPEGSLHAPTALSVCLAIGLEIGAMRRGGADWASESVTSWDRSGREGGGPAGAHTLVLERSG